MIVELSTYCFAMFLIDSESQSLIVNTALQFCSFDVLSLSVDWQLGIVMR